MGNNKYKDQINRLLERMFEDVSDEFPSSMPLLDNYRKAHTKKSKPFKNVEILFIQHHLGPFLLRLKAHIEDGLKPKNTWIIDIPYSTNEEVRAEIPRQFRIPDLHISPPFIDPIAPYSVIQLRRVEEIIYHIVTRNTHLPLLVIDDGAYFVRAAKNIEDRHPHFLSSLSGKTYIVEQTTRGHNYLEENKYKDFIANILKAPAVSIAKSNSKILIESPFIGKAAAGAVISAFDKENVEITSLNPIALIGYGAVGQSVFRSLKQFDLIDKLIVIESDKTKHNAAKKENAVVVSTLPHNHAFQLVIGCTGKSSLTLRDWDCLSGNAYLVSTSSAAVEFNRKQFIDLAQLYPDDEIIIIDEDKIRSQGIHQTIRVLDRLNKRQVNFINASYPVNFDGHMECLPTYIIQVTHTLLYAASLHVQKLKEPGLTELEKNIDKEIFDQVGDYLG